MDCPALLFLRGDFFMESFMMMDRTYMTLALDLAKKGLGRVSPNPMVGAVVVKDGCIVGQGFHPKAGMPHAEIYALKQAGNKAKGGTLYVSLEPCNHVGRTPPCTRAILKSGVKKVVAAMVDPNPLVSGAGIRRLRKHGLEVKVGLLEKEAKRLNEIFIHFITTGEPFGILKVAMSLDGKIATRFKESQWISGRESRVKTHELRGLVDAIIVGVQTVVHDDPLLIPRLAPNLSNPWRVIVDSDGRTPPNSKILEPTRGKKTIVAVSENARADNLKKLQRAGAEILRVPALNYRVSLKALMSLLGSRGITSALFEGGSEIYASALEGKIIQKVVCFVAPGLIGGKEAPSAIGGQGVERLNQMVRLKSMEAVPVGKDLMISGYIE